MPETSGSKLSKLIHMNNNSDLHVHVVGVHLVSKSPSEKKIVYKVDYLHVTQNSVEYARNIGPLVIKNGHERQAHKKPSFWPFMKWYSLV